MQSVPKLGLLSIPNEPDIQLGFWLQFLIRSIKIMYRVLIRLLAFQFVIIQILFKSKNNLVLETIELRQQLMIYQTKKEDSKNITDLTRSLLIALKRAWQAINYFGNPTAYRKNGN
jgi:hypothetical protein